MDLLFHKPPTEFERIWSNLSSSDQELALKQFLEANKLKLNTHQQINLSRVKDSLIRTLQSPWTPNTGGSRKVYLFQNQLLICRVEKNHPSSINSTNPRLSSMILI